MTHKNVFRQTRMEPLLANDQQSKIVHPSQSNYPPTPAVCYYCHKSGHIIANCAKVTGKAKEVPQ